MKKILSLLLALTMVFSLAGCGTENIVVDSSSSISGQTVVIDDDSESTDIEDDSSAPVASEIADESEERPVIDKYGHFFDKENVALYIHTYGHLPDNFITKDQARDLGWEGGSVEDYAPGYAIGGDKFGNYEGLLPKAKGRTYYECDIDTDGYHSRGSRRIVFSNDGLIYYTHDHYESFELLYGEE